MSVLVALGDSYAAGAGAGDPGPDNACLRSPAAYAIQVARALGVDVAMHACQGANIIDVSRGQLQALTAQTSLVTLTVGGNDLGFSDVLTECAKPAWMGDSDPVIDKALGVLRTQVPQRLTDLYGEVSARAPQAKVVVAGYPRLFAGLDCNLLTFFSEHEMTRLNAAADEVAATIAHAIAGTRFEFVDVRRTFEGHAVCEPDAWIRGVSDPITVSFHPDTAGHAAYARRVIEAFGGGRAVAAPREPQIAHGPSTGNRDAVLRLPDLRSDESLDGARRHGLDPDEVADLAGRVPDDDAACDRLAELDRQVRERG
ncbi:SGNH/GDSL hydrolase family protein [Luteipulveratus mongoliensis]|uniref:SGNH/GDSL hydrolase family protein n=1 Tax=Luteipulveratus mongoliensis TaxID=571913 RepID=UPI0006978872|nr:SGNH/GDSL hydrolase family protein [Luteipulveratus mongoliensis]